MINWLITLGWLVSMPFATLNVDVENSTVKWQGSRISKSHTGTISIQTATIEIENDQITGGNFVLDMNSIQEDAGADRLVGHLKSDDFFSVDKFPTASLMIKKSIHQGGNQFKIIADATIKGTTKELKFIATLDKEGELYRAKADFTFDRSEFDVRFGSGSYFDDLGDKVIYDDISISVDLLTK